MKNFKNIHLISILYLLPFVYVYVKTGGVSPLTLNGKQFLNFYSGFLLVNLLDIRWILPRWEERWFFLKWVTVWGIGVGLVRIIQGIYNARPVGYLIVLLVIQVVLLVKVWANKKR